MQQRLGLGEDRHHVGRFRLVPEKRHLLLLHVDVLLLQAAGLCLPDAHHPHKFEEVATVLRFGVESLLTHFGEDGFELLD